MRAERVRRPEPAPDRSTPSAPTPLAPTSNAAAARMLQRTLGTHVAPNLPTPRKALMDYLGVRYSKDLPDIVPAALVTNVPRPERMEAKISAADVRTDERENSNKTGNVTALAKVEQFLTQGAAYTGAYHGGHLIADELCGTSDSFVYENLAPQFAAFNTPAYRVMETQVRSLVERTQDTLLVTAKLEYGDDQSIPADWLRGLGLDIPQGKGPLTFARRIPRTWTLRARRYSAQPPQPGPSAATGRTDKSWKQLAPTLAGGFKLHQLGQSTVEHRAAGVRAPSPKSALKFPAAAYAAAETWKLRGVQWTPYHGEPNAADLESVVETRFPKFVATIRDRTSNLDERERQVTAREKAGEDADKIVVETQGALLDLVSKHAPATGDPARAAVAMQGAFTHTRQLVQWRAEFNTKIRAPDAHVPRLLANFVFATQTMLVKFEEMLAPPVTPDPAHDTGAAPVQQALPQAQQQGQPVVTVQQPAQPPAQVTLPPPAQVFAQPPPVVPQILPTVVVVQPQPAPRRSTRTRTPTRKLAQTQTPPTPPTTTQAQGGGMKRARSASTVRAQQQQQQKDQPAQKKARRDTTGGGSG